MPSRYRFVIEGLILGFQICLGVIWIAPAPLIPTIMGEYQVDRASASLVIALVSLMAGLCTVPMGMIAARFGLRRVYTLGALLLATGALTPTTSDFSQLLVLRLLFGLGAAIIMPVTAALVMDWFPPRELPAVNGLNMVGQSLGITISLGLTVPLAEALGWREALGYYGLLGLALAVGWLLLGRERAAAQPRPAPSWGDQARALRRGTTLILGLGVAGPWALYMALSSWLPTFYGEVFGLPPAVASASVGLFNLVGIPACLVGGFLPTLIGRRKPFLLVSGAAMGVVSLGTFLVNEPAAIYTSLILYGVLAWVYVPSLFTIPMELPEMTPSLVAVVLAAVSTLATLISFLAPPSVGLIADRTGSYLPGFLLWAGASYSLLVAALLLPETGPGRSKPQPSSAPEPA